MAEALIVTGALAGLALLSYAAWMFIRWFSGEFDG